MVFINNMKQEIINHLLNLSQSATEDVPVAAIILDENMEIISEGINDCEKDDNPLNHAEVIAINRALRKRKHTLKGCTLLVTLEPCLMCYGAAINANISSIVYLVRNIDSGAFSYYHADSQKSKTIIHFEENKQALKLLQDFFIKQRK